MHVEQGWQESKGKKKPGCSFLGEKRGSYPSPRNYNCCLCSLQSHSPKRIEAKTKQGEPHGCPQVRHPLAKSLRAATTDDKQCHLTALDIAGPRSRPSISCLSPDFTLSSTGQEKEQCRSRWSCRQIFPEHEAAYGPPQRELNGEPEGVASFPSSAAMLLRNLGQIASFPRSPLPPVISSTRMAL